MNMSNDTDTPEDYEPRFPTLEHEIDGVIANTRISFSLTTVARTAGRGEWSRAIDALEGLADKLVAWNPPSRAWQELLSAAAWYAVRASKIDLVAVLFKTYAERAWASKSPKSMPFGLAGAFELADRRGRFDAGRELAALVETLFPACPLGPYGVAHFRERALHLHGSSQDPGHIAEAFARAAQLADSLGMARTRRRALLRSGALLLRSGGGREEGRKLLRDIDPAELSRADTLWYALGMTHSPFWLDRVRAADALIAVVESDADPKLDALHAVGYLLDCAPLEIQPLEVDRLTGLAQETGVDDAGLAQRSHLEGIASAPISRAGEAADILARSMDADPSDRQRTSVEFCRAVANLLDDRTHEGLDRTVLSRIEQCYPTAARVLEVLESTVDENARKIATALGDLEGHFRKHGHRLTREDLKSIALIWPRLLPFVRTLEGDDEVDQTTQNRIGASAHEIATRWLPDAPTPSYGWWSLAANFLASDLHTQAALAARRALDDGESVDAQLEGRVIATVLDWAIRDGSQEDMLAWLEVAERRLG
jgi:hypothetical protein